MFTLSTVEQKIIKDCIESGLGLSKTCATVIGAPMKAVSEYLSSTEGAAFYDTIRSCLLVAYKAKTQKLAFSKKKFDTLGAQVLEYELSNFVTTISLWQDRCTKEEVSDDILLSSLIMKKPHYEAATSMGMTVEEYVAEIYKYPYLIQHYRAYEL